MRACSPETLGRSANYAAPANCAPPQERRCKEEPGPRKVRAVRDLASVVCDLQHKCNAAMRHLLLPTQLEIFLKAIYSVREAVEKMDPLQNEAKEGKDGGEIGEGSAAGGGSLVMAGKEGEAVTGNRGTGLNASGSATMRDLHSNSVRKQVSKHRRRVAERDLANASVVGIDMYTS